MFYSFPNIKTKHVKGGVIRDKMCLRWRKIHVSYAQKKCMENVSEKLSSKKENCARMFFFRVSILKYGTRKLEFNI